MKARSNVYHGVAARCGALPSYVNRSQDILTICPQPSDAAHSVAAPCHADTSTAKTFIRQFDSRPCQAMPSIAEKAVQAKAMTFINSFSSQQRALSQSAPKLCSAQLGQPKTSRRLAMCCAATITKAFLSEAKNSFVYCRATQCGVLHRQALHGEAKIVCSFTRALPRSALQGAAYLTAAKP